MRDARLVVKNARQVQLLVKEVNVRMYGTFTPLLLQLGRLTQRRRLYGDELYEAAWLMGQLTMHVYETQSETKKRRGSELTRGVTDPSRSWPTAWLLV